MGFWNSVGKIAKAAGSKVIETTNEAKEIQRNEMAYKNDSELLEMKSELIRRKKTFSAKAMACFKEVKDRGLA